LYKIENNSYTKIFSDESQNQRFRYYQFSATEPTKIALYDGSLFEVKKCDDFTAVSSISISQAICNMDFTSNKILGYSEGILVINSANSGQLNHFGSVVTTEAVLFDNHVCSTISQLDLNKLK
jgi:hypothetical protein